MKRAAIVCAGLAAAMAAGCEKLPNLPPTAAFIYSPVAPIYAGETTVVFNATASRDGDGRVASYVWNFGDGTAEVTTSAPTVTHVFPDTDKRCLEITYTALLTVRDDGGDAASASQTVKVVELPEKDSKECEPEEE